MGSKQRLKTDEDSSMESNVLCLPVVLFELQSVAIKMGRERINCQTLGFKKGRESVVRPLGLSLLSVCVCVLMRVCVSVCV